MEAASHPPLIRPYFYDQRGRISKNSSLETLLRVEITKLPVVVPKIVLPVERMRPYRAPFEPATRRSVRKIRGKVRVVGSCGLGKEVFVMPDGTEVNELGRFPGFRYSVGEGEQEDQRFWTQCWDQFRSLKYQYIYLPTGKRIHSITSLPSGVRLVLVSAVPVFKGVKLKQDQLRFTAREDLMPLPISILTSIQASPGRWRPTRSQSTLKL